MKESKKKVPKKIKDTEIVQIKENKRETLKKENRQLIWFFIIISIVFVVFIGIYFYIQSLKTFEFAGVKFDKIKEGQLMIYHARFPVFYNANNVFYNLYLRNDPRKNNASIDENMNLKFYPEVIISHSFEAANCGGDGAIAAGNLAMFLKQAGGRDNITGALSDKSPAEELNLSFANCSNAKNRTVILIQKSDKLSIEQNEEYKNCYIINAGNCENIKAVERFILAIIAKANNVEI